MPDETRHESEDLEDYQVQDSTDSLIGAPGDDPLDRGVVPPERWSAGIRYGTTEAEQEEGESLDQLLSEEEPDPALDEIGDDEDYEDEDEDDDDAGDEDVDGLLLDDGPDPRAGRLVAEDEGAHPDEEEDLVARDVGIDAGGATAEEAAVHVVEEDDYDIRSELPSLMSPGDTMGDQATIALRLRIGITGHRDLTAEHPGLETEIANAVEYIAELLAGDPDRIRSGQVALTAVSSLAEGADRLVAAEILKRPGSQLEIVLPMPPEKYCLDFPGSVTSFEELMKTPGAMIDTIAPTEEREEAYELAGRAVVDRSDVMIVVWDGQPAAGRGGTAQIYEYALRWQKPVVLICVDEKSARLDSVRLPRLARGRLPLPPEGLKRLDEYNGVRLKEPVLNASGPLLTETRALESSASLNDHLSHYFGRADQLALRYQRWWFRATLWLYILAPAAILTVAAQVTFAPDDVGYAGIEFAILVIIIVVLIVARLAGWHQRWVSARYLAEQIRSLVFLGLTGIVTLDRSVAATDPQAVAESSWTERAANEVWFTRPRLAAPDNLEQLIDVLYHQWIKQQRGYHSGVSRRYGRRGKEFQVAAIVLFGLSAVFALLHSLGVAGTASRPFKWWDFLAIAIPGIAAALGGLGAQRDYLRHAERSALFAATLDSAAERLLTASTLQDVQQAVLIVSRAMRSESIDWYTVVHSQDVELPS